MIFIIIVCLLGLCGIALIVDIIIINKIIELLAETNDEGEN